VPPLDACPVGGGPANVFCYAASRVVVPPPPPEVLNIRIGVQVPNSTKHVDQGRGTGRRRMPLSSSYMALSLSERGIPSTVRGNLRSQLDRWWGFPRLSR
jgi:hypothetical protein